MMYPSGYWNIMNKPILLAEDSPDDESVFCRVLTACGVLNPIHVVRDGTGVIKYLKGGDEYANREKHPLPSSLFLDLLMQPMDGFAVLKWLRSQSDFSNMLVIVLTNYHEARMLRDAYAMGADTFLFKPFTEPDLENLLQHFSGYFATNRHSLDTEQFFRSKSRSGV